MADIDLPLSWRMMQDGYLMEINKLRDENAELRKLVYLWMYGDTHDMTPADSLAWSHELEVLEHKLNIKWEDIEYL